MQRMQWLNSRSHTLYIYVLPHSSLSRSSSLQPTAWRLLLHEDGVPHAGRHVSCRAKFANTTSSSASTCIGAC